MTRYDLTYQLTPDMLNRAMMSWAQAKPDRAQKLRLAVYGAAGFVALVAVVVVLLRLEFLNRSALFGALGGFYLAIGLWFVMHRASVRKLFGLANAALARQGAVRAVFSADGVEMTTANSFGRMDWDCFDDVVALPDASVLRAGGVVYAVPDAVLPDGVSAPEFRAQLTRWREARR